LSVEAALNKWEATNFCKCATPSWIKSKQWLIIKNNRYMLPIKLHHLAFGHSGQPLKTLLVLYKTVVLKSESAYVRRGKIG
jgi:hypothetical protein